MKLQNKSKGDKKQMEKNTKLAQAILRMMVTNAEENEELKKILQAKPEPPVDAEEGEQSRKTE